MRAGLTYCIFQYLNNSNTFVDERQILNMKIVDQSSYHVKSAKIRVADKTGTKYASFNKDLSLNNPTNSFYQGQHVRIIHALSGNIIIAGQIEEIEPGDSGGERYVEIFFRDYGVQLLGVKVTNTPIPINPSVINFSDGVLVEQAILRLVESFRMGGILNGNNNGLISISTEFTRANPIGSTTTTKRDFTDSNIHALHAIELLAESIIDPSSAGINSANVMNYLSTIKPQGANFFIETTNASPTNRSVNSQTHHFVLRMKFAYPVDPITQGLTFIYGNTLGDNQANPTQGVYRFPIISGGAPSTTKDIFNRVTVVGNPGSSGTPKATVVDTDSAARFGIKDKIVNDPNISGINEDLSAATGGVSNNFDAQNRAVVLITQTNRPITRMFITTIGYPVYRLDPSHNYTLVRSGDKVRVINPIYSVNEDYEIAELTYNGLTNVTELQLVKPGSGYVFKGSLDLQLLDFYKRFDHVNLGVSIVQRGLVTAGAAPTTPVSGGNSPNAPQPPDTINTASGTIKVLKNLSASQAGTENPDVEIMEVDGRYLTGVTIAEHSARVTVTEYTKALTTTARTFALYKRDHAPQHPEYGADVCTTTHCQAWENPDSYDDSSITGNVGSITQTIGDVLKREGYLIDALYFARCDGEATKNSEDAVNSSNCSSLGWNTIPYLRGRECTGHSSNASSPCGFDGHGVGLCQIGAEEYAAQGVEYLHILGRYYTGVYLEKLLPTPIVSLRAPVDSGSITQEFGANKEYYEEQYGYSGHAGIDYGASEPGAPFEVPVYAMAVGTIEEIGTDPTNDSRGIYVKIRHGFGFTRYLHLKDGTVLVVVGQRVTRGQQIATSGNTGDSSGDHLHVDLELFPSFLPKNALLINDKINPKPYIYGAGSGVG